MDGSPRNLNSSKSQALYGWAPRSLMWASQVSSAIWMSLLAAQEFQRNWGIGSLCGCIYTDFAGRDVQCTVLCCTVQYYIQSSFWAHGRWTWSCSPLGLSQLLYPWASSGPGEKASCLPGLALPAAAVRRASTSSQAGSPAPQCSAGLQLTTQCKQTKWLLY